MQLISINVLPVPIGHTVQQHGIPSQFGLRYCPTMDLVAVFPQIIAGDTVLDIIESNEAKKEDVYEDEDDEVLIDVYRLNGQKIFTIGIESNGGAVGIVDVSWRDDGVVLAIASSDNTLRLVNSFSGKVVHTFSCTSDVSTVSVTPSQEAQGSPSTKRRSTALQPKPVKRRCLPALVRYSTHFADSKKASEHLKAAEKEHAVVLDDLLGLSADVEQLLKYKSDLPKDFANLDVEQFLPKLATLPGNGMGEDDLFSTRTSVDAVFHPLKQHSRAVSTDVVTIASTDAHVHIRVFDSFAIGDVDLNQAHHKPRSLLLGRVLQIATTPFSSKLCIIAQANEKERSEISPLHLLTLDLRFLQQNTLTLPIIATKSVQLHNLVRYMRHIEAQLAREVKTAFDLPARFIRILEQDLNEQDGEGSTFETAAYHTLLTGQVHGKFKEWLVEVLGDRGVKRWDKAVYECLELVRRLINENLNPALERAATVVSRLSGITATDMTFGVEKKVLDGLRDTIDVLAVLGEDLLRDTISEIEGFGAFIRWLKREVEMAGLEDTSEKLDEMRDASEHADLRKVMKYISERLNNTSVRQYIVASQTADGENMAVEDDLDFYRNFKEARLAPKKVQTKLSLKSLIERLSNDCARLFQQIAEQLRANIRTEYICKVPSDLDGEQIKARLITEDTTEKVLVLSTNHTKTEPRWIMQTLSPTQTTLTHTVAKATPIEEPHSGKVLDSHLVNDKEIMLLIASPSQIAIMSGPLDGDSLRVRHVFGGPEDAYTKSGLVPWRLEINPRKGRRTVTVLDEHGRGYGVFDLDLDIEDKGKGNE